MFGEFQHIKLKKSLAHLSAKTKDSSFKSRIHKSFSIPLAFYKYHIFW